MMVVAAGFARGRRLARARRSATRARSTTVGGWRRAPPSCSCSPPASWWWRRSRPRRRRRVRRRDRRGAGMRKLVDSLAVDRCSGGRSSRRCWSARSPAWSACTSMLRRLPFFVVAMSHATFPGVVHRVGARRQPVRRRHRVRARGRGRRRSPSARARVLDHVQRHRRRAGRQLRPRRAGAVGAARLVARPVGLPRRLGPHRDARATSLTTVVGGGVVLLVLAALHKELVLEAFDRGRRAALGYPAARLDDARAGRRHRHDGRPPSRPSARCWPSPC